MDKFGLIGDWLIVAGKTNYRASNARFDWHAYWDGFSLDCFGESTAGKAGNQMVYCTHDGNSVPADSEENGSDESDSGDGFFCI